MKNSYDDLDSLIESTHFAKKKQHSASPKAGSETPVAYVYEKPGGGFAYELFDGKQRIAFGAEKTKDLAVKSVGNDANAVFGKAVKVTIKFERPKSPLTSSLESYTARNVVPYFETAGAGVTLHFKEGNSNKVWGYREKSGGKAEIFWGKVGAKLGTQIVPLAKAKATHKAKLAKGYKPAGKSTKETTTTKLSSRGGKYVATRRGRKAETASDSKPVAYVYKKPDGGYKYELYSEGHRISVGAQATKDLAVKHVINDASAGGVAKPIIKFGRPKSSVKATTLGIGETLQEVRDRIASLEKSLPTMQTDVGRRTVESNIRRAKEKERRMVATKNKPHREESNALEAYAAAHAVKAGDNIRIGQTILNQLGANKFTAMTGAKRFVWLSNGVQFDIPVANKINRVTVRLTPTDEYDVEFGYMRGMDYKVVKKVDGIQAAELQNTFTNATGLRTRL